MRHTANSYLHGCADAHNTVRTISATISGPARQFVPSNRIRWQPISRNYFHAVVTSGLLKDIFSRTDSSSSPLLPHLSSKTDLEGNLLLNVLSREEDDTRTIEGLESRFIQGQGRGIVAKRRIRRGETALLLPKNTLASPQAIRRRWGSMKVLGAIFTDEYPDWTVLAIWLSLIMTWKGSDRDEDSSTVGARTTNIDQVYAAVLPSCTGCVLEWSAEEVELLHGSHLHSMAISIRSAFEKSWEEIQDVIGQANLTPGVLGDPITKDLVRHAFGLLLSRLVRLDDFYGGTTEAICPGADLLNHDPASTAFLRWCPNCEAVQLIAEKNISVGEQIMISYGEKTDGELLLSYGFVPTKGSNPHDGCLFAFPGVTVSTAGNDCQVKQWKERALERRHCEIQPVLPLKMNALPEGILRRAAFVAGQVNSEEEVESLAKSTLDLGRDDTLSPVLLRSALQCVMDCCKLRLGEYKIGLEEIKSELYNMQGRESDEHCRRKAILEVLLGEQRILSRTIFVLQSKLKSMKKTGL